MTAKKTPPGSWEKEGSRSSGTSSHARTFECLRCGRKDPILPNMYVCRVCGGNLLVLYDMDAVSRELSRETLAHNADLTLWRYLPLLPVREPLSGPPVGWTPLFAAQGLAQRLGIRELFIKDEGRNPSASLKDRASAIAIAHARATGHTLVVGASTGNAAAATAVLGAANGIQVRIFVPRSAPRAKVAQLLTFGAEVIAVDGTYDQAFELSLYATKRFGWYNRNTGFNPYTREGKKTVSFEICEQMGFEAPDLVVVPVGDGNIISGVFKGFEEFFALGLIEKMPRLLAVQAEGSDAVVRALAGDGQIRAVSGKTVADSISVSLPRDGEAAVRAVRASNGFGITVSDDAILDAIGEVARSAGVFVEPAAAAGFAGIRAAVEQGLIDPLWRVVVLATGNGLKDIGAALSRAKEPRSIAPDPSLLEKLWPEVL